MQQVIFPFILSLRRIPTIKPTGIPSFNIIPQIVKTKKTMDRQFTSFNELAAAPAFGSTDGISSGHVPNVEPHTWDSATLNMARFNGVAEFKGCPFYACANETQHGGFLEPPHIHIKLKDQRGTSEQKFWLSPNLTQEQRLQAQQGNKFTRSFDVSFARGNAPEHVQTAIIKHLKDNEKEVKREWNQYVLDNYKEFSSYSLFSEK